MKHWEKNKKDTTRSMEDRESQTNQFHDHKKKKLKPVEKSKYRVKPAGSDEEDNHSK